MSEVDELNKADAMGNAMAEDKAMAAEAKANEMPSVHDDGRSTVPSLGLDSFSTSSVPAAIEVHGARVHNLKNIDVSVPLHRIVAIAGVSGSGKSSLALGVLYAEGSRRYLEALSTYTRRRMTQASKSEVDKVLFVPAALALHQRPGVPNLRSTFGTGSELLNSVRLMFSRLASHRCPNGHYVPPTLKVAAEQEIICPECGVGFYPPGAEDLAFNSRGACPCCKGTGVTLTVDRSTLVPDETKTIDEGAVLPWGTLMWSLMTDVCREMGVRTNVPFKELTAEERDIVFNGPAVKKHILYVPKNGSNSATELDFTYYNAVYSVENALSKVKDDKGMKRVEKFLREDICPECLGSRLSEEARAPLINGDNLATICTYSLKDLIIWASNVPKTMSPPMQPMAYSIVESLLDNAKRLVDLGLDYLSLDRASNTLSTGERQRMQLARSVRNRTTGVLYVLDEPSIGLHPANMQGLNAVMDDLIKDGNSVILVDHDPMVLSHANYLIELGPQAGTKGGAIVATGPMRAFKEGWQQDGKDALAQNLQEEKALSSQQGTIASFMTAQGIENSKIAPFLLDDATLLKLKGLNKADRSGVGSGAEASYKQSCDHNLGLGKGSDDGSNKALEGRLGVKTVSDSKVDAFSNERSISTSLAAFFSAQKKDEDLFAHGTLKLKTKPLHTVKALEVSLPKGRLITITGVSGSGKTTLILESLIPALDARIKGSALPSHIDFLDEAGISAVKLIDASPIGINVRSTVATYANVHDELRKLFAKTEAAKERKLKAGDFSYNTGSLRCPSCDGTGQITLDVQFLPDVEITCPDCRGCRYAKDAHSIKIALNALSGKSAKGSKSGKTSKASKTSPKVEEIKASKATEVIAAGAVSKASEVIKDSAASSLSPANAACKSSPLSHNQDAISEQASALSLKEVSLPQLMNLEVSEALALLLDKKLIASRLQVLQDLGLGYLKLGEDTPSLSGGEAQRLKLASEMGRAQNEALFVFDEPTIGLHPLDVAKLMEVFKSLLALGATVVVIEHDLDVISQSDYVVDLGPGGGDLGGQIVKQGTVKELIECQESLTGRYLKAYLEARVKQRGQF